MGQPKLLLPLAGSTVLEHVLSAVRLAGVADVLVVVAPEADALAEVARGAGAHVLRLDQDTPDMRTTATLGLDWMAMHWRPAEDDRWLLLPADHPTVRPEVVRALLAADAGAAIVVPTFQGRRGHPTRIRWSLVPGIRDLPPDQGLNRFVRMHEAATLELPWPSDEILRDLDTPEDYERLLRQ